MSDPRDLSPDLLTIRYRVRPGEALVISAYCPKCGQRRGQPRDNHQDTDGTAYYLDTWTNRCGHRDLYDPVVFEARVRREIAALVEKGIDPGEKTGLSRAERAYRDYLSGIGYLAAGEWTMARRCFENAIEGGYPDAYPLLRQASQAEDK